MANDGHEHTRARVIMQALTMDDQVREKDVIQVCYLGADDKFWMMDMYRIAKQLLRARKTSEF